MASPYVLPSGKVQIAFSVGRTSAYMLRQILDANGGLPTDGRVQVTFQNTGREMPQTLDFVAEVGRRWGNQAPCGAPSAPPSPDRARDRAVTYPGIAAALADHIARHG